MSHFTNLQKVVVNGNKEKILELVQQNIDVKSVDDKGNTLLHLAFSNDAFSQEQVIDILEIFLDQGVDINVQNKQEKTILHLAVERQMRDVLDFCLRQNADVNVKAKDGDSIAHFTIKEIYRKFPLKNLEAYEKTSINFVNWMMSRGFDFFGLENIQRSPLYLTINLNLHHILLTLLKHINELPVAKRRQTALLRAFWENYYVHEADSKNRLIKKIPSTYESRYLYDIVKMILEKTEFIDDNVLDMALRSAVRCKADIKVIEMLAKRITNVNFRNLYGETTVETFAFRSHSYSNKDQLAILRILLLKGANMNRRDLREQTLPQKLFRSCPTMEMLRLLKDAGTDFNTCFFYPNDHFLNLVSQFSSEPGMIDFIINETSCDINMANFFGETPLLSAINREREFAAVELIKHGANINVVYNRDSSPLSRACEMGEIQVIEKLIEHGVDLNYTNANGGTLLHLSLVHPNVIELLLKSGLDVNAKDSNGKTPLYFAMTDMIIKGKILLHDAIINHNVKSALATAFESGKIEVLEKLIEYGADLDYRDKDGKTLLHLAVNYRKVLELLLKKGLDINAKDNSGKTTLAVACNTGQIEVIKMLLDYGADINCKEKTGKTLLHLSVYDPKVAKLLLEKGVDANAKDNNGKTSLAMACAMGQTNVVKILIKRGADLKYKGEDGKTLLHLVMNYSDLIELFLKKGLNVNAQDNNGKTPLHFAINDETVKILLSRGAILDVLDKNGHTPLYDTLCRNETKSISELIKGGSNVLHPKVFELAVKHFEEPYTIEIPMKFRYLKRHLVKLTAACLLDKMPYARNGIGSELQIFLKQCQAEVDLLKTYFINDDTSLYDFLRKNLTCRCDFVDNDKLKNFLKGGDNEKRFRNYFVLIQSSYNEAVVRKSLVGPTVDILSKLTGIHLPYLCIDQLFTYLNNIDLLKFIELCKIAFGFNFAYSSSYLN